MNKVSKLGHLEYASWETAWKGTRAKASAQFVHIPCTSLGTLLTLELHAWALLVHYIGTAWVFLAHLQYNHMDNIVHIGE